MIPNLMSLTNLDCKNRAWPLFEAAPAVRFVCTKYPSTIHVPCGLVLSSLFIGVLSKKEISKNILFGVGGVETEFDDKRGQHVCMF
jgi:hypothetical protein